MAQTFGFGGSKRKSRPPADPYSGTVVDLALLLIGGISVEISGVPVAIS
jgi:hypothetical protein